MSAGDITGTGLVELSGGKAAQGVVIVDSATGAVSTGVPVTGPLTNAQLRASPVPISGTVTASGALTDTELRAAPVVVSGTVTASGPLTDAQLRASAVPVTAVGASSDVSKVLMFSLWTDGTTDGSSGGTASLSGNFSVTPRIIYYTAPAGGVRILSVRMFLFAGSALNVSGWGTAAGTLTNGIRMEVVTSNPTDSATVPVWRLCPANSTTGTLIKSNFDLLKACRSEVIGARWNQNIVGILDLPPGGIPVAAGSSFRVVAQDDTSSVTGCRVEVTVGPL